MSDSFQNDLELDSILDETVKMGIHNDAIDVIADKQTIKNRRKYWQY